MAIIPTMYTNPTTRQTEDSPLNTPEAPDMGDK